LDRTIPELEKVLFTDPESTVRGSAALSLFGLSKTNQAARAVLEKAAATHQLAGVRERIKIQLSQWDKSRKAQ
jgi:hypothetical protein